MKQLLFIISFLIAADAFTQITFTDPAIHYVSDWQFSAAKAFFTGRKIVFRQECDPEVPADIVNGTVFLAHVHVDKEHFPLAITFKDTIVVSVTYYFTARQKHLLPLKKVCGRLRSTTPIVVR